MPWKIEDSEKDPELSKKRSWLTLAEQKPGVDGLSVNAGVVRKKAHPGLN